jgi:hypothetical protein
VREEHEAAVAVDRVPRRTRGRRGANAFLLGPALRILVGLPTLCVGALGLFLGAARVGTALRLFLGAARSSSARRFSSSARRLASSSARRLASAS